MSAPEPPPPSTTPAGWYPDPKMPGTQRFWDGRAWTDHVAPLAPISAPPTPNAGSRMPGQTLPTPVIMVLVVLFVLFFVWVFFAATA